MITLLFHDFRDYFMIIAYQIIIALLCHIKTTFVIHPPEISTQVQNV